MANAAVALTAIPGLWRGKTPHALNAVRSSGYPALDAVLGHGGLPCGALTEVLTPSWGMGELSLFLPLMRRQLQHPASLETSGSRLSLPLIAPPFTPNALALAAYGLPLQQLWWLRPQSSVLAWWSAEQLLRCGHCPLLLFWSQEGDMQKLKRLQLAAEHSQSIALLFRPQHAAEQASPAALRLRLSSSHIEVLKARGGTRAGQRVPFTAMALQQHAKHTVYPCAQPHA